MLEFLKTYIGHRYNFRGRVGTKAHANTRIINDRQGLLLTLWFKLYYKAYQVLMQTLQNLKRLMTNQHTIKLQTNTNSNSLLLKFSSVKRAHLVITPYVATVEKITPRNAADVLPCQTTRKLEATLDKTLFNQRPVQEPLLISRGTNICNNLFNYPKTKLFNLNVKLLKRAHQRLSLCQHLTREEKLKNEANVQRPAKTRVRLEAHRGSFVESYALVNKSVWIKP